MNSRYLSATGSRAVTGTWLLTNGARSATCRPALQAGDAAAVKSPRSMSAVGTNASQRARIGLDIRALIPAEEENPVLGDRAADGAAELVAPQRVLRQREGVLGIEAAVADELEEAAVDIVGARLGDDVDDGGGVVAVARGERARLDLEFLEGIRERHRQIEVGAGVVVVGAVHDVDGAARAIRRPPRSARSDSCGSTQNRLSC